MESALCVWGVGVAGETPQHVVTRPRSVCPHLWACGVDPALLDWAGWGQGWALEMGSPHPLVEAVRVWASGCGRSHRSHACDTCHRGPGLLSPGGSQAWPWRPHSPEDRPAGADARMSWLCCYQGWWSHLDIIPPCVQTAIPVRLTHGSPSAPMGAPGETPALSRPRGMTGVA